jgi:hypothetical protein
MADLKISLGQVSIPNYLLVRIRKVSDPTTTFASQSFGPPPPPTINIVFPNVDPVTYYVDYYSSVDGVALTQLLGTFVQDAKDNVILLETRYYKVGSGIGNAPDPNQPDLNDPYLLGKTLFAILREGVGRPLAPPTETFKEYDLILTGGFTLLQGPLFSLDEIVAVQISYVGQQSQIPGTTGVFAQVVDIPTNVTLDNTYYNKRLRCESVASSRLVITLPLLSNVPDGTAFLFNCNGGLQYQTKILPNVGGDQFRWYDGNYPELWFMKGESIWIEKRVIATVAYWEVVEADEALRNVLLKVTSQWKDHPNFFPEDATLYDGDDYPRPWWILVNRIPASLKVSDANVTNGLYVHPVGKEGMFVFHPTQKKFRVPNTQGWSERGLTNFDAYGADASRQFDFPGGSQPGEVGQHSHDAGTETSNLSQFKRGSNHTKRNWNVGNTNINDTSSTDLNRRVDGSYAGTENVVKNIGVIYGRRF